MSVALEVAAGVFVERGRGTAGGRFGWQSGANRVRVMPGGWPDTGVGELFEALDGEVLGEVAEGESGPVGVLDGLVGRPVQGFVEARARAVGW
ncbi:hypothetical protein [Streptomyces sp. HJ7]